MDNKKAELNDAILRTVAGGSKENYDIINGRLTDALNSAGDRSVLTPVLQSLLSDAEKMFADQDLTQIEYDLIVKKISKIIDPHRDQIIT